MAIRPYILIARPDNWFKNVFMVPGVVLALFFDTSCIHGGVWLTLLVALVSTCLVASSNYVLNEILDAKYDRLHPEKKNRPVAKGEVRIAIGYAEWVLLAVAGIAIGFCINIPFGLLSLTLWLAGAAYNIPPVRLKDAPYADVVCESFNNPLRMALGWYATGVTALPPVSILLAYWMFGAFLMAMKRYAEYCHINDPERAGAYRMSFRFYTTERLLESIFFYGALFGMFAGIFIARYHAEVILAAPLVAYAMAYYMHLGFKPNSPVQYPESLYRQRKLMWIVAATFVLCSFLLFAKFDSLSDTFRPTVPDTTQSSTPEALTVAE